MRMPFTLLKRLAPLALALGFVAMQAQSAFACGSLVAPDGDVRLARATTLVAWHDGIERYMTSFAYQGDVAGLGWIVPLPTVPLKIEEGGRWTLQRLFRETHPIQETAGFALDRAAPSAAAAQVIEQVKIEALNITVLRGSGQSVIEWCTSNGFFLNADTRAHLLIYGQGSPIFMAAKYDTTAAKARGQIQGDGAPVVITMQVPHIWVPLEVLALEGQPVQADLYLLTDGPVTTSEFNAVVGQSAVGSQVPGAPGFTLSFQEQMNPTLYHDLSTDRNMSWVRPDGWLTYLSLDAPETTVNYDLGVTSAGVIKLAPFGTAPMAVAADAASPAITSVLPHLPIGTPQFLLTLAIFLAIAGGLFLLVRGSVRAKKA
jgi:Uncharacterized protein conserved in bacteria (DUF2330)